MCVLGAEGKERRNITKQGACSFLRGREGRNREMRKECVWNFWCNPPTPLPGRLHLPKILLKSECFKYLGLLETFHTQTIVLLL